MQTVVTKGAELEEAQEAITLSKDNNDEMQFARIGKIKITFSVFVFSVAECHTQKII